jgi:hypothetical protein
MASPKAKRYHQKLWKKRERCLRFYVVTEPGFVLPTQEMPGKGHTLQSVRVVRAVLALTSGGMAVALYWLLLRFQLNHDTGIAITAAWLILTNPDLSLAYCFTLLAVGVWLYVWPASWALRPLLRFVSYLADREDNSKALTAASFALFVVATILQFIVS